MAKRTLWVTVEIDAPASVDTEDIVALLDEELGNQDLDLDDTTVIVREIGELDDATLRKAGWAKS